MSGAQHASSQPRHAQVHVPASEAVRGQIWCDVTTRGGRSLVGAGSPLSAVLWAAALSVPGSLLLTLGCCEDEKPGGR